MPWHWCLYIIFNQSVYSFLCIQYLCMYIFYIFRYMCIYGYAYLHSTCYRTWMFTHQCIIGKVCDSWTWNNSNWFLGSYSTHIGTSQAILKVTKGAHTKQNMYQIYWEHETVNESCVATSWCMVILQRATMHHLDIKMAFFFPLPNW